MQNLYSSNRRIGAAGMARRPANLDRTNMATHVTGIAVRTKKVLHSLHNKGAITTVSPIDETEFDKLQGH